MEDHEVLEDEPEDAMIHLATHLCERLDTMNTILAQIAESLDMIRARLDRAPVL